MEPVTACHQQAYACAEAVVIDAAVTRPGLTSFSRPRSDLDPLAFAALAPRAYEACLCSCLRSTAKDHTGWLGCWLDAIESLTAAEWGNPGMGMLFLLSLQAAALGYTVEKLGSDDDMHVMGAAQLLVEQAGVEGAKAFYRALQLVAPSYLGRLSWNGLPDATTGRLALAELWEKQVTLRELLAAASLYDPVARDAATGFSLSFGEIIPLLLEHADDLATGVRRATYYIAGFHGDFLLRRKRGGFLGELWRRAYMGDQAAEEELYRLLEGAAGPGSSADVVANAVARLLYLAEAGRITVRLYPP
ncbi:triphosphoribosyl-dephospho-CoA synthase [Hyperthermus butylicus]|uniref:Uncharacterized protein n=1 Tax=Hyperthermus butylicus (strain DSM 5456 / JCM 9403 / PLM1-5) TaxID=415426 RepID=A2BLP8_HYPBU|nr:triphosphoribosyl-dephospho-CoA synthase [Hyperthermus butylicus]ABM80909.1 hypothetical protein Hbut_1066 [Hyperthermus butylicus DSM 5456]